MTGKHRSMRGKLVDMNKLAQQHELMPAIGNMKVNARGDELGAGGKIVRRREDIISNYYETNPKATKSLSAAKKTIVDNTPPETIIPETKEPPQVVVPESTKSKKTQVE